VASKLSLFLAELKRRKVYRVAAVYAAVGVAISIAVPDVFGAFGFPDWAAPLIIVVIAIGFPIALVLAWAYEVKPEEPRPTEPSAEDAPPSPDPLAPTGVVATEQRKSIVVLPFDNMSPDPGDAYFSDGLTEEIITHLSYLRSLRVISRNSAMVLKGTEKDTRTIGRELDVQYVLEGSVRKAGNDLRITAQLIDAASDTHIWAEKYDGVLDDVFGIQEQVSRSIVDALQLKLSPSEKERLAERPIEDLGAYECYLKARHEIEGFTVDGTRRAIQHLESALEIVGPNALLFAGMGYAHFQRTNLGMAQEEAIVDAEENVSEALAMDPDSPFALAVSGLVKFSFRGKPQEAVNLLKRALAANPNEPLALMYVGGAYAMMAGKTVAAGSVLERLEKVDPLGTMTYWLRGALPFFEGDFRAASTEWGELLKINPDNPLIKAWTAPAVAYAGDLEGALHLLTDPLLPDGEDAGSRFCRIQSSALKGDKAGALREITPEFRQTVNRDGAWAWLAAAPLAFVGAVDEAVGLLEHGVRRGGFINYPMLSEHDLRGDPRYQALLEEAKQRWENFEV